MSIGDRGGASGGGLEEEKGVRLRTAGQRFLAPISFGEAWDSAFNPDLVSFNSHAVGVRIWTLEIVSYAN